MHLSDRGLRCIVDLWCAARLVDYDIMNASILHHKSTDHGSAFQTRVLQFPGVEVLRIRNILVEWQRLDGCAMMRHA
jgi:hypothetical protein